MAEIHVQPKKTGGSSAWLWILIVLLIVAAVGFWLWRNNAAPTTPAAPANTTAMHTTPLNYNSLK